MKLTDAQAKVLKAMREGASLYGRVDDPQFLLIWGTRPDETVSQRDALDLLHADLISPWLPWPDLTPEGAAALAEWEAAQ